MTLCSRIWKDSLALRSVLENDEELSSTHLPAFDGLYAAFNRLRYGRDQAPRFEHAGQGGGDSA